MEFDAETYGMCATAKVLPRMRMGVTALIVISAAATGALSLNEFDVAAPFGCGLPGACANQSHRWSKILVWPASFLGLAYFAALLVAWLRVSHVGVPAELKVVVGAGACISAAFLIAMAVDLTFCLYCLAAHVCNLGTLLLVARIGRSPAAQNHRWFNPACVVFGVVLVTAAILHSVVRERHVEQTETGFERSLASVLQTVPRSSDHSLDRAELLRPRYTSGSRQPIFQIVVFSNYRCPPCARLYKRIEPLIGNAVGVGLGFKHLVRCSVQEGATPGSHDPCAAARAAEAAGAVWGAQGFWTIHRWLVDRRGAFAHEELMAEIGKLCRSDEEMARFQVFFDSPESETLVENDRQAAHDLGVRATPTIFVNGVKLEHWHRPGKLEQALDAFVQKARTQRTRTMDIAGNAPTGSRYK